MIPGLALAAVVLSVVSENESEREKDWTEQFDAIDRLRKEFGIPTLTAKERMGLLLGKWPNPDLYYLDVCEYPRRKDRFQLHLYWGGKKKVLPLKNQERSIEVCEEAIALARSLYISWGPDPA